MNIKIQLQEMKLKLMSKYTFLFIFCLFSIYSFGQTEFTTWGNITGIRIDNQLMEFNTSLVVVDINNNERKTDLEKQKINFKREGLVKTFSYEMDSLIWNQAIKSTEKGKAEITVDFISKVDTILTAAYFRVNLPKEFNTNTKIFISNTTTQNFEEFSFNNTKSLNKIKAKIIRIESLKRQLEIILETPTEIILKPKTEINSKMEIDFLIASGEIVANKKLKNIFNIKASGELDIEPLKIKVFPKQEGRPFDGIGGNFRLQNPDADPQVIDYCLENLRVSWSRVEMPWMFWHPDIDKDPIEEAKKGNLHPRVKAAMEMAQKLDKKGIPVILATWFGPDWAIIGERSRGERPDGTRGNHLNLTKKTEIYNSITSYIKYLKEIYGVKTVFFSFNEADLGIDVKQTAHEHNEFIKEMGTVLESQGLETKFLLGDTADANGWPFTTLGSTDPESRPYIGGVSFHSWRGWTRENLIKWLDIANRVDKPLFVGEGSIDAGAWRYPQLFEEPTYALDEIEVYIKILNIAQPLTILQWQLTSDYSVLSGGGVFGNSTEKLHPTQRFYNLKQLGETPKGLFSIPITVNSESVTCAALGDIDNGNYTVHIVNKGASRKAIFEGFPDNISKMEVYVTNKEKFYGKVETVALKNGSFTINLEGASYITLMTE